jgi:hypothetical protein
MKTYEFDVVLKDVSEVTDDDADKLFGAGCDDGTPAGSDGVAWIHFAREAASLEEAMLPNRLFFQRPAQKPEHLLGRLVVSDPQIIIDRGVVFSLGGIRCRRDTCFLKRFGQ